MDLEMTGLDPDRHTIVEIATLVTDDDLRVVAEGPDLVVAATAEQLDQMDKFVRDMHTRSGLLQAVQASNLSLADAGSATLEFLRQHLPESERVPLAGNSIGTDRRFLAAQLPELDRFFHYRSVDVSTVKELARRWNWAALSGAPAKRGAHRAMDDIKESVAELAYYRQVLFREPEPEPHGSPAAAATGKPAAAEDADRAAGQPSAVLPTAPEDGR
jgi:oligoribonuclease